MDLVNIIYNMEDWKVVLGEVFNVIVYLIDEVNNFVLGIVNVSINSNLFLVVYFWLLLFFFVINCLIRNICLFGVNGSSFFVGLIYFGS